MCRTMRRRGAGEHGWLAFVAPGGGTQGVDDVRARWTADRLEASQRRAGRLRATRISAEMLNYGQTRCRASCQERRSKASGIRALQVCCCLGNDTLATLSSCSSTARRPNLNAPVKIVGLTLART